MKFAPTQITFKSIASREDRIFHKRCRQQLGIRLYMKLVPFASLEFQRGLKHPNVNKKINTARRFSNMVFTKALLDYWDD